MGHEPGHPLVIGADIGGTSTRVAVADLTGRVLSLERGGPGNPNSVGLEASTQQIRSTTQAALDQVGPDAAGRVAGAVFGLAGITRISDPEAFLAAVTPADVSCRPRLVSDFAVAFSSGTPERDGYALIAGTGAGASRITDDQMVDRRDGWGWLLGDDGSGFWLGRAAVRATLRTLESRQELGPLGRRVLDQALDRTEITEHSGDRLAALVSASFTHPPIWLASFAVLVSDTHDEDPVARRIASEAGELLADTVQSLELVPALPIVLGGSVLTEFEPIKAAVAATLAARLGTPPTNPVRRARAGVLGALWIAARDLVDGDPLMHASLLATTQFRS